MAKKVRGKFPLKISLIILAGIALAVTIYKLYPRPQVEQAGIFVITTPLEYGYTTVSGVLLKDSSASESGNFYILTSDNQIVVLDLQKIDSMIGFHVTAKGFLNPPTSDKDFPYMTVSEMKTN